MGRKVQKCQHCGAMIKKHELERHLAVEHGIGTLPAQPERRGPRPARPPKPELTEAEKDRRAFYLGCMHADDLEAKARWADARAFREELMKEWPVGIQNRLRLIELLVRAGDTARAREVVEATLEVARELLANPPEVKYGYYDSLDANRLAEYRYILDRIEYYRGHQPSPPDTDLERLIERLRGMNDTRRFREGPAGLRKREQAFERELAELRAKGAAAVPSLAIELFNGQGLSEFVPGLVSELGGPLVPEVLVDGMFVIEDWILQSCTKYITEYGPAIVPVVVRTIEHAHRHGGAAVGPITLFYEFADLPEVREYLLKLLEHPHEFVVDVAAGILGEVDDPRVLPALEQAYVRHKTPELEYAIRDLKAPRTDEG